MTAEPEQQAFVFGLLQFVDRLPRERRDFALTADLAMERGMRLFGCFPIVGIQAQLWGWLCTVPGEVWHLIPENNSSFYSSMDSKEGCSVLYNCSSHMALWLMGQLTSQSYTQSALLLKQDDLCYRKCVSQRCEHAVRQHFQLIYTAKWYKCDQIKWKHVIRNRKHTKKDLSHKSRVDFVFSAGLS